MAPPAVQHRPEHQRFEIPLDEGEPAVAAYRRDGRRLVLTHTHVPREREGAGLATALAHAAFGYARAEGLEVVPQCAFMDAFARQHPEYDDLAPTRS